MKASELLNDYRFEITISNVKHKVVVLNEKRCKELLKESKDIDKDFMRYFEMLKKLHDDYLIRQTSMEEIVYGLTREELVELFFNKNNIDKIKRNLHIYEFNGGLYQIIRKEKTDE